MDVGLDRDDVRVTEPEPAPPPAGRDRRTPLPFAVIAYLLLVAALLGLIYLGVLALMQPAILPAIRLLTQQG